MNSFFRRFKFKYQRYAIKNLSVYASVMFAIGYLALQTPWGLTLYSRYLAFYPGEVLRGQIWRILTAIIYPPVTGGVLYAALGIFIYYNFASIIERSIGSFEFNVYFFGSFFIGELGSIVCYLLTGIDYPFIPMYTHFSVFMAFAILYAESTVLLFFIIPVKTKYLAAFELALYTYYFIFGDSMSRYLGYSYTRISIIAALIPVYLFYRICSGGGSLIGSLKKDMERRKRQKEWKDQWK